MKEIASSSQVSYFNDFDKELKRKLPVSVIGHISTMSLSSHRSYFNDFDKELQRKLHLAVMFYISMIFIRN